LETTGAAPGDSLALALIGHVTVSALQAGPFADLHTVEPLDTIIYRAGGWDYVYAVSALTAVQPEAVDRLYVAQGDHLLLVTCTDWNLTTNIYEGRLIVDAVLGKQVPAP
jgi:LPXTG-site transpeptidase (sortase) family protein